MKKFTLFFLLVLSIGAMAQTSKYHQFPQDSVTWHETDIEYINPPFSTNAHASTRIYTLKGDTVINDSLFSIVYLKLDSVEHNIGLLYDDTISHKVFFREEY